MAENRLTFANEKDPSLASWPLFGGVLRVLSNELAKDSVCLKKEKKIITNTNSKFFDHCNREFSIWPHPQKNEQMHKSNFIL